jgi:hypothetical protein
VLFSTPGFVDLTASLAECNNVGGLFRLISGVTQSTLKAERLALEDRSILARFGLDLGGPFFLRSGVTQVLPSCVPGVSGPMDLKHLNACERQVYLIFWSQTGYI